jgi:hypothetical protein
VQEGRQAAKARKEMERPAFNKSPGSKETAPLNKMKSFFKGAENAAGALMSPQQGVFPGFCACM